MSLNLRISNILNRDMDKEVFKVGLKFRFTYIGFIIFVIGFSLMMMESDSIARSEYSGQKKAVILILDEVSLSEMLESDTPTIDKLRANGATGFMNIRSRSSVGNKGSNYLSLGMGTRTLASTQGHIAFDRESIYRFSDDMSPDESSTAEKAYNLYNGEMPPEGEIINLGFGDVIRTVTDVTPNYEIGLLGRLARENGLTIGLVGNRDTDDISRPSTLLAMDEKGVVPLGSIDSDMLKADNTVLGGIRLDEDRMMEEVERILPQTDILFIDYGDAVRVEDSNRLATDEVRENQKLQAIERADSFLKKISDKLDSENTLYMIITPNPSRVSVNGGNFGITPIVVSGIDNNRGLLSSTTTRRKGLVANFDFGPTLLGYFEVEDLSGFGGSTMDVISDGQAEEALKNMLSQSLFLRTYREVFHWIFIGAIAIFLLLAYLPKVIRRTFKSRNKKVRETSGVILNHLALTALLMPIMMMTVSLVGYRYILLDILYMIVGSSILAYIINKTFKDRKKSIAFICVLTSLLLLVDVYNMGNLMIVSPLGSDAIAGGRFYGMGNDYMGVLLGSTLLGLFSIYDITKFSKASMTLVTGIYMSACILMLSPFFGANMGGTLSAIFVLLLTLLIISEKKFSVKRVVTMLLVVGVVVIIIAGLDATFNPNPTHAGKALESLMSDGWSKFVEIIVSKLGQLVWNLINSSWNVILFGQILIGIYIYKFERYRLRQIALDHSMLFKGIKGVLFGSIVIFAFNDTGTIATAIALSYGFIPLGLYIQDK